MLERFRQRYPLGSLSSELLTIDRGKYLVRTSIQVNGTLLGTGMGEGDTIEQAEDQARLRAIAVLALDSEIVSVSQLATEVEAPKPRVSELSATEPLKKEVSVKPVPAEIPPKPAPASKKRKELPTPAEIPLPVEEPLPLISAKTETEPLVGEPIDFSEVIAKSDEELPTPGEIPLPVEEPLPLIPAKTETEPLPLVGEPINFSEVIAKSDEELPTPAAIPLPVEEPLPLIPAKTETEPLLGEPIDFSEVIAKSDMELKRLGWTNEQGRNYLLATYGKRSRQLLSDEELIEFMQYLQSLPNP